jgi:DNA-binding NtrC family response regulator
VVTGTPLGAARLLIVDDELALLGLLKRYLERLGYQVDLAGTAEEALAIFTAAPRSYACVLTDLTMPGMNGEELVERMRELTPKLPAIISSGYPYQPKSARTGFLQKPYLPQMLVEAVEKILGKSGKSGKSSEAD